MIKALIKEINIRKGHIAEPVETIYFGGGTPSLLLIDDLSEILKTCFDNFQVSKKPEITLEANPDDLSKRNLDAYLELGINRLSVGLQTFDDERLKFTNRTHTAKEGYESIKRIQKAGFSNYTVDLIFAIPPEDNSYWEMDINTILELNVPHLSTYGLTIEENTVFGKWKDQSRFSEISEETNRRQYDFAIQKLTANGYGHYEVSSFCKPGFRSRHNSSYWQQKPYLGIGPGAHTFDGKSRSFNVRHNAKYIQSLEKDHIPTEIELLSEIQLLNEYILTRLRTYLGIDAYFMKERWGFDIESQHGEYLKSLQYMYLIGKSGSTYKLTSKGMAVADEISLKFFSDDE